MSIIELHDTAPSQAQGGGRWRGTNGAGHVVSVDPTTGLPNGNATTQAIPDYESASDLLAAFGNFSEVNWGAGDFVSRVATSNGQILTALSANPFTPGESRVVIDAPLKQPCKFEFEGSIVRNRQQFVSVGLFANDASGPAPVPNPINIVNIHQSSATNGAAYSAVAGTIATITLESALPEFPSASAVFLSDWINITGLVDTRLNYQNACISFISADRKVITVGFSDEGALPSLAIPVVTPALGTAKVIFYNNAAGAAHGAGFRFTGVTDTTAAIWSVFGGGDAQITGALLGDHRNTISSSATTLLNGVVGQYELKATSRYRIDVTPERTAFYDRAVDTFTAWTSRILRSAVKPGSESLLRPRIRVYQPEGMSRPVAKIISVSKTGTTTATVIMDVAPTTPLAVGNIVSVYGVRDQANFVATSGPITAVDSPTQFKMVIGSAVTATSYGGDVCIINGGAAQPGVIGQAGSNVATNIGGQPDWLNCTYQTTISGLAIGMYVNLHGWRQDLTGADLNIDGVWEVAHLSSTTAWFKPVYAVTGQRVSPVTPSIPSPVNCGGTTIVRTTARMHDLIYDGIAAESVVRIAGQGTIDYANAVPVALASAATANQGTAATISTTDGSGGWPIRPSITGIADIASAAITATANSAAIANDKGNGFQLNFPVTAATGTSPTLDIRIEESFDGGTTFITLYEMQRITAVGNYNTPILRATGRHIRYVRTITGTTPSFTMAATRNLLPFIQAEPQKRLMDRTIVPNTLNSVTPTLFSGAANNVQLVVAMLAITTTAPQIQIEGSEDGTNWYAIGTPLLAVASATVEMTVAKSATFVRARVSTAGSGATLGYISLKAWS